MRDTGLKFAAHIEDFGSRLVVIAYTGGALGERSAVAGPVIFTMTKIEDDDCIDEPTLRLPIQEAQRLFDAMWGEGMRPTGFKNEPQPDSIAAREHHIADLRAVLFAVAKIDDAKRPS